jgi:hypothetical protein
MPVDGKVDAVALVVSITAIKSRETKRSRGNLAGRSRTVSHEKMGPLHAGDVIVGLQRAGPGRQTVRPVCSP